MLEQFMQVIAALIIGGFLGWCARKWYARNGGKEGMALLLEGAMEKGKKEAREEILEFKGDIKDLKQDLVGKLTGK